MNSGITREIPECTPFQTKNGHIAFFNTNKAHKVWQGEFKNETSCVIWTIYKINFGYVGEFDLFCGGPRFHELTQADINSYNDQLALDM